MPSSFQPDSAGLTFIANLCINSDHRFIEYILEKNHKYKETLVRLTGIEDINIEINLNNKMLGCSPIIAIFLNGKFELIKAVLDYVVFKKSIRIDINQVDSRKRNLIHSLIYNKMINSEECLYIFENYISKFTEEMAYSAHNTNFKLLFNQVDKDGFLPIVLYLSRIKVDSQEDINHEKMFEILNENTDFDQVFNAETPLNIQHPLIVCIKSKLHKYFSRFLEISKILKSQIIYCEKQTKRSTIEYAFDSQKECFILPILDSLKKIDSFVLGDGLKNSITLFDIFFSVIKSARNNSVFATNLGEEESSHPIVKHIKQF